MPELTPARSTSAAEPATALPPTWRDPPWAAWFHARSVSLWIGGVLGLAAIVGYAVLGYSMLVLALWLTSLAVLAARFAMTSARFERVAARDVVAPAALTAALAPLYLLRLGSLPVQVNSDEVAIGTVVKQHVSASNVNLFGLSSYFGSPNALFVVWGRLANVLGGIDLSHMRLLHALCGLATVALSYALFRQLLSLPWALLAAALLGLDHAFLMISRMAMRENTVVLVEVTALALLLHGLRRGNEFTTFCGGAVAGLGFYVYFPGRVVFPLWIAFLLVLAATRRREFGLAGIARAAAIAATGFVVVAGPYFVAYAKAPAWVTSHQREALLLTSDGRELQRQWVFEDSVRAGIERNVVNGLGAFNNNVADEAWIYPNPGHGIVDPLTGVLLWIGVVIVLLRTLRPPRSEPWSLLPLVGFLLLWLTFAFVVGQAPDYPRMLVILPFVAYFAAEAVRGLATRASRPAGARRPLVVTAIALGAVLTIGLSNAQIARDFIRSGRANGDDIGSTGRYIQARAARPGETFFVAADEDRWRYFVFGTPAMWEERLRFFARSDSRVGGVIEPRRLAGFRTAPPFAIFMPRELWSSARTAIAARYPHVRAENVTPDGHLVAVEVI